MATKAINLHYDFQSSNQIKNVLIDVRSSDPGSPAEGQFWYNSTSHVLKYRDNGTNQTLGVSGGGLTNAYATVTDGTTPQAASGGDTLTVSAVGTGLTVDTSTAKTLKYTLNSGLTGSSKVLLLTAGGKITASVGQQVWATTDLTDVGSKTGSGTAIVFGTGPTLSNPIITGGASTAAGALGYSAGALSFGDGSVVRTVVTVDGSQTLTNKSLTAPVISTISNTGTLTLPVATDTLIGKATTDTLTNKTYDTAGTGNVFKVSGTTISAVTGTGSSVVLATSPTFAATGGISINAGSGRITNVTDPTSAQDAATKNYVDISVQGLQIKPTATLATTAALPTNTYANGTSGVGATLTATSNAALTVDGVAVAVGNLVLVKNEATSANNGLYTVTQTGSGAAPYILTRHVDMDQATDFSGAFIPVGSAGTTNANSLWLANPSGAVTVGTTAIPLTELNKAADIVAGNGIAISGATVSASLTAGRLVFNGSSIDLASSIVTPGTYTSVTVDTYGRTTAGADIITSNGGVYRTAAGTFTARTIAGTTNRVTVTNGDGVAGAPTIDIHASYVGQSTITTLGTITTGTWTGTTIAVANGGTGQTTAAAARGTSGLGSQTAPASATNVTIAAAGIPTMVKATLTGTGAATSFTVTHNLNNLQPIMQLLDSAGNAVDVGTQATDANTVVFTFNTAPANASTWLATVIG